MSTEERTLTCPFCGKVLAKVVETGQRIDLPARNVEKRGGAGYIEHKSSVEHFLTVEMSITG